jgi:hypothetical protein
LVVGNQTIDGGLETGRDWARLLKAQRTNRMMGVALCTVFLALLLAGQSVQHWDCPPDNKINEHWHITVASASLRLSRPRSQPCCFTGTRRATLSILGQPNLLAVNPNSSRCLDCQKGPVPGYSGNANDYLFPDDELLADTAREHQHGTSSR